MNFKDALEIILGMAALIGIVYQIAQSEKRIYDEIDALKDLVLARMSSGETKFDVHRQDYINHKEVTDYKLGGLNEKIEHKFSRLHSELKDMQRFMEKQFPFRVRGSGDE